MNKAKKEAKTTKRLEKTLAILDHEFGGVDG